MKKLRAPPRAKQVQTRGNLIFGAADIPACLPHDPMVFRDHRVNPMRLYFKIFRHAE
jgi:hypothetical protein